VQSAVLFRGLQKGGLESAGDAIHFPGRQDGYDREVQMITLDRDTHKYSNGLPAVSTIMVEAGLVDASFFTPEACLRGSAVHLACEYFDQGDLDEESVGDGIRGYLNAYKRWRKATGNEPLDWIEMPVEDKTHLYAGTPDRVIARRPRSVIDIKTGDYQRYHRIQLAAYVNCLDDPFSYSRYGLYLLKTGKFKVEEFPKAEFMADLAIFQSALNLYYWRNQ